MKQSSCCQVAAIAAMLALSSTATAMSASDIQAENGSSTAPFSKELITQINEKVASDNARLIEIYKDLHQHPEIGYTEVRTASIVSKQLRELGFVVTEGIAKTGVVGVLKNGEGPTVWYRADMDALQVREATGLE